MHITIDMHSVTLQPLTGHSENADLMAPHHRILLDSLWLWDDAGHTASSSCIYQVEEAEFLLYSYVWHLYPISYFLLRLLSF